MRKALSAVLANNHTKLTNKTKTQTLDKLSRGVEALQRTVCHYA